MSSLVFVQIAHHLIFFLGDSREQGACAEAPMWCSPRRQRSCKHPSPHLRCSRAYGTLHEEASQLLRLPRKSTYYKGVLAGIQVPYLVYSQLKPL